MISRSEVASWWMRRAVARDRWGFAGMPRQTDKLVKRGQTDKRLVSAMAKLPKTTGKG